MLIAVVVLLIQDNGWLRTLDWIVVDQAFSVRSPEPQDDRIVIVSISEADITYVQQWPMTDARLLQALTQIQAQAPRLIGLDIYRDLPVNPGHDQLQDFWTSYDNIIAIEKVAGDTIAPPPILAAKGQVAASDLLLDRDGKIRRALILLGRSDGSLSTSLGAALALGYLADEGVELTDIDSDRSIYGLGKGRFVPLVGRAGAYEPDELGGYQILLNYRGGLDRFATVSLTQVLTGDLDPDLFRDRIVLIGSEAPSLNDNHRTPYNNSVLHNTPLMPGVVIHANLTSQMISAALDGRNLLRPVNRYLVWVWIVLGIVASVNLGLSYTKQPWLTWLGLGLILCLLAVVSYGSFHIGWILPVVAPGLGVILGGSSSIITTLWIKLNLSYRTLSRQHQQLQQANQDLKQLNNIYRCFVPLEYVQILDKKSILDIKLGDHVSRSMAISFSDIRNFTSICETRSPGQVFEFVNDYLQRISPEICNHGGVIIKFMGDAIMAIFPQSPEDAIAAGLAQYQRLREYNEELAQQGQPPIAIGMGIHLGRVMVGVIGEAGRMQGDVLSDAVNVAARLESLTKFYGTPLLVSGNLLSKLPDLDRYRYRLIDEVMVKGRTESISLFEILDAEQEDIALLKAETQLLFEQGCFDYRQQKFTSAKQKFYQVLQKNPHDKAAKLYLSRIQQLQTQGVPPDWTGVWQFTDK